MDYPTAVAARKKSAVSAPVAKVLTRQELLVACSQAFAGRATDPFKTLVQVEKMDPDVLRGAETAGTAFEIVEGVLVAHNFNVDGTVGRIMDAVPMNQSEVHYFACSCNHGAVMTGERAKLNLEYLANNRLPIAHNS